MNITDFAAPLVASQMLRISNDDRLRNIVRHWNKVRTDPNAKVPTTLALLLDAAALAIGDEDARYAENRIRADQRDRLEGANDDRHDNVKAGS